MKIKPEDMAELQAIIGELGDRWLSETWAPFYHNSGHSERRCMWDALWSARRMDPPRVATWFDDVYQYANDDHVTTALRKVLKPYTAGNLDRPPRGEIMAA